jgi:hypothetical protein
MLRLIFAFLLFTTAHTTFAQWGTSFSLHQTNALRFDWAFGNSADAYKFGTGVGFGTYYSFPEKTKKGLPIVQSLGLELQQIYLNSDYAGSSLRTAWVRMPIYYQSDVLIKFPQSDKSIAAITSTAGLNISRPLAIESGRSNLNLPTKLINLGYTAGLGFQIFAPFDMRFKIMYQLSLDAFSLGAKTEPSYSKIKFIEQGFQIGMQRSFAGEKEQRKLIKAERAARKKQKKSKK